MAEKTDNIRAECGFDGTPVMRVLFLAMGIIPLLVLLMLFGSRVSIRSAGGLAAYISCVGVMAAALILKAKLGRGRITVDEEYVNIHYGFLGKKLPLSDITYFSCDVETQSGRYGGISYTMVLTIKTSDGERFAYEQELCVEDDLPAKAPEKYRKYLDEQPMMKLCSFVKEIKGF